MAIQHQAGPVMALHDMLRECRVGDRIAAIDDRRKHRRGIDQYRDAACPEQMLLKIQ